jgi:hypothetical protein
MKKTTITCDCCRKEMNEATDASISAQLRYEGIRFKMDGELDKPATYLEDICDECAIVLHQVIRDVIEARKLTPANT